MGFLKHIQTEEENFARKLEYFYPNGKRKYLCIHNRINATETDTRWKVMKETWNNDGSPLRKEKWREGAVNSEAIVNAYSPAWQI